MTVGKELRRQLVDLRLSYLAAHGDEFVAHAIKRNLAPLPLIEEMCRLEMAERSRRTIDARITGSRVNTRKWKALADFDWSWPKKIDRDAIERLFTLNFLEEPANVVFVGASSLGKTMLARNLVHQAAMAGKTALIVEAHDLLTELEGLDSARALRSRLKHYTRPALLVIDELGYLSYSHRAGDLLFQIINARYEKVATAITTNVSFKDWGTVFPGVSCVSAMLERLLHRCTVISIEGDSYRMKEAECRKNMPNPSPKKEMAERASKQSKTKRKSDETESGSAGMQPDKG